jgi:hypothetical protein
MISGRGSLTLFSMNNYLMSSWLGAEPGLGNQWAEKPQQLVVGLK